ncbi:MAG: dipeptide/oligopeptide/nickel ABC transporter permease/ATP-binding protein [Proteobacteria bacterium]|nr:dipeptide/oligopeptide/nickel ABC transporter permease/ATP-binding protein [Pseudomonadota bacterium]MBI3498213.1 dipeptide/oligopeptide/nickel ABC transporter permease/ATP-binding protein [Pseudomonadota bacterium]
MKRLWVPGACVGFIVFIALAAPLLGLPDPVRQDVPQRLSGTAPGSWLGRDEFGRDVLSRLIWGARTSLAVAFASALLACLLGTALGLIGGWLRGVGELLALRSADVILCFPPILLALLVVTLLGPGAATLILVVSVLYLPGFVRVAYGEVLSAKSHDYVEAVRALGAPTGRILMRTLLPNIAGPVLVQLSLAVAAAVVLESGLSFLGLGVVPPAPSWGLMIRGARATMEQAPLLLLWPCAALTLTILAMNRLCDALRDTVDPRTPSARPRLRLVDHLLPGLAPPLSQAAEATLAVSDLTIELDLPHGRLRPVEDVSLSVKAGEMLAIVGESGSGKSLTALAVMGLLPPVARPVAGSAWFGGKDLLRLDEPALRRLRGGAIAMIYQDPMSSLNPVLRVGDQVTEAIRAHRALSMEAARAEALMLFRRVGIADPELRLAAYPHEMSGGMRQRVMIAMALANRPRLLIADEPTTAVDVTVQAQILDLLMELKRESGTALIFITHSLSVVAEVADRVTVMYAGQVVEDGLVEEVFQEPLHPYTSALLAALPEGDETPTGIPGVVPLPNAFPPGCRFAPRCAHAASRCTQAPIPLLEARARRRTRCIRWAELSLGACLSDGRGSVAAASITQTGS